MSDLIAVAVVDLKAGPALDWAVGRAIGGEPAEDIHDDLKPLLRFPNNPNLSIPKFSTDWAQGGHLIDQLDVWIVGPLDGGQNTQAACVGVDGVSREGVTKLEAAMKAIVAAKFGDAVTVPRELVEVKS